MVGRSCKISNSRSAAPAARRMSPQSSVTAAPEADISTAYQRNAESSPAVIRPSSTWTPPYHMPAVIEPQPSTMMIRIRSERDLTRLSVVATEFSTVAANRSLSIFS